MRKLIAASALLMSVTLSCACSQDSSRNNEQRSGSPVEVTDDNGYRFEVTGKGSGVTPQVNDEISAKPGNVFVYVDVSVTNKQADRSAELRDALINWYIHVPSSSQTPDDPLKSCGTGVRGYCGDNVSCLLVDEYDEFQGHPKQLGGLFGQIDITMPAGATWNLRCFLGTGGVTNADEVKETIKPTEIRLFRLKYSDFLNKEVTDRTEIPLR